MFRIKRALLAIKKRWVLSLLLLLQFTIGLSILTGAASLFNSIFYIKNSANSMLDPAYTYLPLYENLDPASNQLKKEEMDEVFKRLEANKDVKAYGTYSQEIIPLDKTTAVFKKEMLEELTIGPLSESDPMVRALVIDENYSRFLNLSLSEGKGFSSRDFETGGTITNVIAGSFFKKYFQVGDTIHNQYKIIGFLPENQFIVYVNFSNAYQKSDKLMLLPMPVERAADPDDLLIRLKQNTVLQLRENADLTKLKREMKLDRTDGKATINHMEKAISDTVRNALSNKIPLFIASIGVLFFSITGIVITSIVSMKMRKREFGIRMAVGESKAGILVQLALENVFIAIAGFGLSQLYFYCKNQVFFQLSSQLDDVYASSLTYNTPVVLTDLGGLLCLLFVSNLIVFFFLRKLEPRSFTGGIS
ncbi:ABC transporter permease [Bacillus sp. FJAT-42376]|uniref:ABC transporter permease n=1 Tax=Bacillus sp. FJAT-42376 TaxID=2014076 RepID=UPI000F4F711C|nr:ABC transporter permease [Bacillus sp. FJAT-42376]AZB41558.1 ABC transporter permease [Bacillus sp. FJAT-42376]